MDLYEYQARDLFENYNVPVLQGIVATSSAEAERAAEKLGGTVIVKAQVKVGGRGKAGGVKLAHSPAEAAAAAKDILGLDIKGHTVRKVMVAEGADIAEEYYFSIMLDRTQRQYLAMLSREGGMDIEKLAEERPEALVRRNLSPLEGLTDSIAREIAEDAGFPADDVDKLEPVLQGAVANFRRRAVTTQSSSSDARCGSAFSGSLEHPADDHRIRVRLLVGKHRALAFP